MCHISSREQTRKLLFREKRSSRQLQFVVARFPMISAEDAADGPFQSGLMSGASASPCHQKMMSWDAFLSVFSPVKGIVW